jgi:acyl-CoA synthetase (NDP forming)
MTTSGGTVDLLHDYCEAEGAVVPDLAPETVEAVRPFVPADCHIRNPIDTGAPVGASGRSSPAEICKLFAADPGVDMVAWCNNMPGSARSFGADDQVKDLVNSTDKPVICFARMLHNVPDGGIAFQEETNMPFVQGTRIGVRVMNALWFYAQRAGKNIRILPEPTGKADDCTSEALETALEAAGIPAPKTARAINADEAGAAAAAVGFPAALKIISPEASHKTEIGGVALNIADAADAVTAADAMQARLKANDPSARIDGFLAQEMVTGTEMLVGARDDALYGPMIILGAGGVMVELMRDVAIRLLPVTGEDVRAMLGELKSAALLDGYRGAAAADKDALIEAVVALGDFYLDHRHVLADLEINPLTVRARGDGVCAVDIRTVSGPA